jgi:hypothetical protein
MCCIYGASPRRLAPLADRHVDAGQAQLAESLQGHQVERLVGDAGQPAVRVDGQLDRHVGARGAHRQDGHLEDVPKQFFFQDRSFTDPGMPEPSTPAYYRVPVGKKFEFDIDYSKLAKDPNADKSAAGYLYAPGTPVAVWN